jgi:hypothetical protein
MRIPEHFRLVFGAALALTVGCGLGAATIAFLSAVGFAGESQLVATLFSTLLYLFSAGVGVVFFMVGTYLSFRSR